MGSTLLCSVTQPHLRPDDQDSPYCPHPRYRSYWNVPGTVLAQGFVEETGSSTEESLASTTQEAAARFYAHPARPCPCPCSYAYSYSCHQQCSHHQLHEYALPSKGQEEAWKKLILPFLSQDTTRCGFFVVTLRWFAMYVISCQLNYCASMYHVSSCFCLSLLSYSSRDVGFIYSFSGQQ